MAGMRNAAERIEAALKRLKIKPESASQLPGLVAVFSNLADKVNAKTPAKFLPAGQGQSERELRTIAKHAAALKEALAGAHQPTIVALADQGFLTNNANEEWLLRLAGTARKAEPKGSEKPTRGRPPKAGAAAVASLAVGAYRNLTGEEPSVPTDPISGKPYGPFFKLVAALFSILRVKANAEAAARKACKEFLRRKIAQ